MRFGRTVRALTALIAAGSLAACTSGATTTSPDTSSAPSSGPVATVTHVGDPVTLQGNADGSQVQVTVKQVTDTTSKDKLLKVSRKNRLVAVQFLIVNTGTADYDDAPSNGAVVVDSTGQQFQPSIVYSKVSAGAQLPVSLRIAPGSTALGYLVFEVPKDSTVARVQFAMDSGFGASAQWDVP